MLRKLVLVSLLLFIPLCVAGGVFLVWGYHYITRDLPRLDRIEDYKPPMVSQVYSADGTLIAEFYKERRYPAKLVEVPLHVRNAFLAAEDASFYSHPGIDLISIFRAFVKNIQTGSAKQGGSTITQQVVKNLLLSSEKKLTRKLKEAILSYRLEQKLSKDDILSIYLNQIYFGAGAYGIKAAAKIYFHKELSELTIAEGALLAGLPKAPSRYSPLKSRKAATKRQRYVLGQMVSARFISRDAAQEAKEEEIEIHAPSLDNIYDAPYFASELRRVFQEKWKHLDIDRDGLRVYTPVDLTASHFATTELRRGLRDVDKRRGWRGPIGNIQDLSREEFLEKFPGEPSSFESGEVTPALVENIAAGSGVLSVFSVGGEFEIDLGNLQWAKRHLRSDGSIGWVRPQDLVRVGDVIEIAKTEEKDEKSEKTVTKVSLDQTPQLEGALVLLEPSSGKVRAMVGGYSYQRSQFNRVTQSYRQPGSAFKPIVYLAAVDGFEYTPATIVYDTQRTFRVGDSFWTPGNFDHKFLGGITLRSALEKSRNLVSADIISRIGVDAAIRYARKLGITSKLGRNLSLSLGSSEITLLEMTRAYGVFANQGVLFDSVYVDRIQDRDGNEIYNYEAEKLNNAKQVISEQSAFIMANLMKGVVQRGTGWRIRALERPAAGKTGTSNDLMDAWFIGYTPSWVAGVWVGFDLKKTIGAKETGGKVSSPIWLNFMSRFLDHQDKERYEQMKQEALQEAEELGIEYIEPEKLEPLDFAVPEGVDPMWVSKESGRPTSADTPGAIYEYFVTGTEPRGYEHQEETTDYLSSPEL